MHVYLGHLTFTHRFELSAPAPQLPLFLANAIEGCDAYQRRACDGFPSNRVCIYRSTPGPNNLKPTDCHTLRDDGGRLALTGHAKFAGLVQALHRDAEAVRARNGGKGVSNV